MSELIQTATERRRNTRSSVFKYIYDSPVPCTKQQIAYNLGLSLPTVYQDINELISAGLVEKCGILESSGGRPATAFNVVSSEKTAIGVTFSSKKICFISTDLSREITGQKDIPYDISLRSRRLFPFIAEELEIFIDENAIRRDSLVGVGFAIPGIIVPAQNSILYSPTLDLRNYSLSELSECIPYDVRLENDATASGFAEWCNSEKDRCIAFLSLSSGVGGAVLVNGAQYNGSNNRSGEFGHMCIERGGRKCACGKFGCLEAYCSTDRISTDLGISLDTFFEKLNSGNPRVKALWNDYVGYLVTALHDIRMCFDCDIVIGGYLAEYLSPYIDDIRVLLSREDPFDPVCKYVSISKYSKWSSNYGVAMMFIKSFLDTI